MPALKIGLLGGSFNPAHDGHRHISLTALKVLALDQIWWLVSPQNPLKSETGMAEYDERLASAKEAARHPKIKISDFENRAGTSQTAKTIAALKVTYPQHKFVWLMGADNLVQFPHWYRWESIMNQVPIAVFNRPGYRYKALNGMVAQKYKENRVLANSAGISLRAFPTMKPPAWTYLPQTAHKVSSTEIRNYRDTAGKACS
ncbi:nicotinate-nucleotide adenylyltransferase [Sneathiella sp.]|uniref:nicotinate-nucleotide adenylyltransferase n=1 Tax=Sneathiella sp. TaxID=1964365 RepID=UPI003561F5A8